MAPDVKEETGFAMFSQLGPLFKTTFRQAESTDTRQDIKHYEKDDGRKKREQEDRQETSEFWEDTTSVSTEALRTFLVNFLKTIPEEADGRLSESAPEAPEEKIQEYRAPKTSVTARALHAYQSMNEKTHTGSPPPRPEPENMPDTAQSADGVSLLPGSDVRIIHTLIDDLKTLSEGGLETLTIQKADSFLDSLVTAVNLEKSRR